MSSTNIYPRDLQSLINETIEKYKHQKFEPTYLYIKQHSVTGKLYFGKTVQNPVEYSGSGTHWLNHLNEHDKNHVETIWFCLFFDLNSIIEFALMCSYNWDIVKITDENNVKIWANLIEENGVSGGGIKGHIVSQETRDRIGLKNKNNVCSDERKRKMSLMWKGKPLSQERRDNLLKFAKMRIVSEETRAKLRKLKHSDETKKKIGESSRNRVKITVKCPYCGKEGAKAPMTRHHFDNCSFLDE